MVYYKKAKRILREITYERTKYTNECVLFPLYLKIKMKSSKQKLTIVWTQPSYE